MDTGLRGLENRARAEDSASAWLAYVQSAGRLGSREVHELSWEARDRFPLDRAIAEHWMKTHCAALAYVVALEGDHPGLAQKQIITYGSQGRVPLNVPAIGQSSSLFVDAQDVYITQRQNRGEALQPLVSDRALLTFTFPRGRSEHVGDVESTSNGTYVLLRAANGSSISGTTSREDVIVHVESNQERRHEWRPGEFRSHRGAPGAECVSKLFRYQNRLQYGITHDEHGQFEKLQAFEGEVNASAMQACRLVHGGLIQTLRRPLSDNAYLKFNSPFKWFQCPHSDEDGSHGTYYPIATGEVLKVGVDWLITARESFRSSRTHPIDTKVQQVVPLSEHLYAELLRKYAQ